MKRVKARHMAKRLAERAGYQITRLGGRDAGDDIRATLRQTQRPIVLDVGANTGQSVVLFRQWLPECQIHCFEPGESAYQQLERNTAGFSDLHLNRVGVGATAGVRRLLENEHSDMSSFLQSGDQGWGTITREYDVPLITLDDYCSEMGIGRVDLLKSDTQGYELEVLKGAEGLLRDGRVVLVYIEVTFSVLYQGQPGFDALYRFLVDRDMRLVALYNTVMDDGVAAW